AAFQRDIVEASEKHHAAGRLQWYAVELQPLSERIAGLAHHVLGTDDKNVRREVALVRGELVGELSGVGVAPRRPTSLENPPHAQPHDSTPPPPRPATTARPSALTIATDRMFIPTSPCSRTPSEPPGCRVSVILAAAAHNRIALKYVRRQGPKCSRLGDGKKA